MLHPAHLPALHELCRRSLVEGRAADKVMADILKADPRRGSRDRASIASYGYDLIRWWRTLSYLAAVPPSNFDLHTLHKRLAALMLWKNETLPHWREFAHLKINEFQQRIPDLAKQPFAVQESYPDDLHTLVQTELGESWQQIGRELNIPAAVHLRWNTLKGPYQANLLPDHIPFGPEKPQALQLTDRKNLFALPAFKEGYIEVQDAGSQMIAPFLQAEPGQRVVDACAGAGGKTLHLAALMENKGKIIAMDVHGYKLEELKRRARRASAFNVETREINKTSLNRLRGSADRLLLDVPCSGLGVLKRNPDAKWRLNPESISQVRKIQTEILENYASLLKTEGKLVYATCSILPSENRKQVELFLKSHPNFDWEDELHIHPGNTDGFYMARLRKK